jgi:hypothetical protein
MKNSMQTSYGAPFSYVSMSQGLIARSVDILHYVKKTELHRQEGVSPPPCPTPNKISFGPGWKCRIPEISEIYSPFPIPTGVAKAAGQNPRSVSKFQDTFIPVKWILKYINKAPGFFPYDRSTMMRRVRLL